MTSVPSGGPALALEDRSGRRVLTITATRVLVRTAVVVPVLVVAGSVWAAAPPDVPWWPGAVLVVTAVVAAALPDTGAPLVLLAATVTWWLVAVPEPSPAAALLVAACLLAVHTAAAHAAAGPSGCVPSRVVVARLLVRCSVVLALTAALTAMVAVVDGDATSPPLLVAAALLAVAALPWLAGRRA